MDKMKKKLLAELTSLAHGILSMKKKDDLVQLHGISREVYEKLSVLRAIDRFVDETPQNEKTKKELVKELFNKPVQEQQKEEKSIVETPVSASKKIEEANRELNEAFGLIEEIENSEEEVEVFEEELTIKEEPKLEKEITEIDRLIEKEIEFVKPEEIQETQEVSTVVEEKEEKQVERKVDYVGIENELENAVPIDVAVNILENAVRLDDKKTLNDIIHKQKNLQIDLNDRIAFVKNLFGGSQEDFNRVLSQLNTMSSEKEARNFLKLVKKEYDWGDKETYEERLYTLIEKKFN